MKAQLHLGEAIMVAVMLIILIVVGLAFRATSQNRSTGFDVEELVQSDLAELTIRAANLPELACTVQGLPVASCYDVLNAELLSDVLATNDVSTPMLRDRHFHYQNLFGDAKIELEQIYPTTVPPRKILIYDVGERPDTQRRVTHTPILLYDPQSSLATQKVQYTLGIVRVTRYR